MIMIIELIRRAQITWDSSNTSQLFYFIGVLHFIINISVNFILIQKFFFLTEILNQNFIQFNHEF